jgi:hypothetical protein
MLRKATHCRHESSHHISVTRTLVKLDHKRFQDEYAARIVAKSRMTGMLATTHISCFHHGRFGT